MPPKQLLSNGLLQRLSSLTLIFRKRLRGLLEPPTPTTEDASPDADSDAPATKRARRESDAEAAAKRVAFEKREKELDDALPEEMRKWRPTGYSINIPPTDRPVRIYADGVFDLFHLGHMRQLEQAKKAFPNVELVCGIPLDVETHKRKGLTVLSDDQRCETLKHCRWVDEVIPNAPWSVDIEFVKKHKIDYVAHDDLPYAGDGVEDVYAPMKERGLFLSTQRTEGILTLDIITKIIRDYDKYLMRNFARGATRKELNVLWLKKNELDLKKTIAELRGFWKKLQINAKLKDLYTEVREYLKGGAAKRGVASVGEGAEDGDTASESESELLLIQLPARAFAAQYGGDPVQNGKRSFLQNVKGWLAAEPDFFESEEGEAESTELPKESQEGPAPLKRLRKRPRN